MIAPADLPAICRLYRMSLHSSALRWMDLDREFSETLQAAADVAGELAEAAEWERWTASTSEST